MENNKKFWSRYSKLYEKFVRGSKSADAVYSEMEKNICDSININMNVLELAAGPGVMSRKIALSCKNLEVTDFSEEMILRAKEKDMPQNVTFSVADATDLKYSDEMFDAVIIANALHIMPYPDKALTEIKRVLKSGGILIAPTFTREKFFKSLVVEKLMELIGFKNYSKWTSESYIEYIKSFGFKIVSQKIITGHNFPITFLICK
ncbi:MAG: class I SAM-dependent methyltransferase [Clostridium butyricum]|nr:class I SAM-dependent methyltransferase [Clostridium butyricum]